MAEPKDAGAYALAVVVSVVAVAVTRFTWPFFAGTPLLPLFAAVALATHFGTGPAGLLALRPGRQAGSVLAFPVGAPSSLDARAMITFVIVGVLANRILAGRNRAEALLQQSEAEFRAVWEHAALGAALLNTRGEIERINPALERLLGASAARYAGVPLVACSHPDDVAAERDRLATLMIGMPRGFTSANAGSIGATTGRSSGDASRYRPFAQVSGRADRRAFAILEDITARRQGEQDLRGVGRENSVARRKQKRSASWSPAVAHNFNNLLTVTMG